MPRPTHILTVRTKDGSPIDIDPIAQSRGRSETSLYVYGEADRNARLDAAAQRPDLAVTVEPAPEIA